MSSLFGGILPEGGRNHNKMQAHLTSVKDYQAKQIQEKSAMKEKELRDKKQ